MTHLLAPFKPRKEGQTKMLDTSDIRHFVIPKIRETILYINRYEKAAEAIAAIVGMGASLQVRPKLEVFHNGTGVGGKLGHPLAVITHVVTGRNGSGGTSGGSHCTDSSGCVLR